MRRNLFEGLTTNQDQLQESAQLGFPERRLSKTALNLHHQGSSQGFDSLPQTTTGVSEQLFTTRERQQNIENSFSTGLVFPHQVPATNSNSHQQHSPRSQTENADSSALRGQSPETLSKLQ